MSWSLQVSHGDLVFNGTSLATVEGTQKLVQDMTCGILEPMGTDNMHPTYGSVIDGGTLPDGTYQEGIIGDPNDQYAANFVSSEINRVASNLQQTQAVRNQNDLATYGRSTLTPSETLAALGDVQMTAAQNQLLVAVELETGTGPVSVAIPANTAS